jgi:hypothetical protein
MKFLSRRSLYRGSRLQCRAPRLGAEHKHRFTIDRNTALNTLNTFEENMIEVPEDSEDALTMPSCLSPEDALIPSCSSPSTSRCSSVSDEDCAALNLVGFDDSDNDNTVGAMEEDPKMDLKDQSMLTLLEQFSAAGAPLSLFDRMITALKQGHKAETGVTKLTHRNPFLNKIRGLFNTPTPIVGNIRHTEFEYFDLLHQVKDLFECSIFRSLLIMSCLAEFVSGFFGLKPLRPSLTQPNRPSMTRTRSVILFASFLAFWNIVEGSWIQSFIILLSRSDAARSGKRVTTLAKPSMKSFLFLHAPIIK